jgi:riboflavin biosynthesis pyrimidine reductase
VQSLFPATPHELTDEDLVELYAYPAEQVWLRANFVSTVDGAVQGPDRRSGSLSDAADKRVFSLLRSLADVVLVGAATARVEGYAPVKTSEARVALRARLGLTPVPSIAVVSRSLTLSDELVHGGRAPTVVITTESAPAARRAAVSQAAPVIVAGAHDVDFVRAVEALADLGFSRLLCEGGPALMRDLAASGRLDELCLTIAPQLIGGPAYRMTRGSLIEPPSQLRLRHLLEQDGELFCRYVKG